MVGVEKQGGPTGAGTNLHRFGHMRVRSLLEAELFDPVFDCAPLAAQFSSLGRLDGAWLTEFETSFSAGSTQEGDPAAPADMAACTADLCVCMLCTIIQPCKCQPGASGADFRSGLRSMGS